MLLSALAGDARARALPQGLRLTVPPFTVALKSAAPALLDAPLAAYPDYEVSAAAFADVHVEVAAPRRRGGSVSILIDGVTRFAECAPAALLPHLEWAINWCVATRAHQYLMLHAAVLERDGAAVILPGLPGSGKSTLAAYLSTRGWRLLSDEFGMIHRASGDAEPFVRLVPLKDASIAAIRERCPDARVTAPVATERKGMVAHFRPDDAAVRAAAVPATPALVVLPRFQSGADFDRQPLGRARVFVECMKNSFNYNVLGVEGFAAVTRLAEQVSGYRIDYSRMEEVEAWLPGALAEHLQRFANR